jgi:formylglycine-generating enzyme required for sulfatase activity/predicted Ser/Thr protein kinase
MTVTSNNTNTLPSGYQLEQYRIQSILGQGEFGITYLAHNTAHYSKVVILKEYFPKRLAIREDNQNVLPKFEQYQEYLAWGLELFRQEGQALIKLQHPNIVKVLHYFEAHNTAYIVMEYIQGQSLEAALKTDHLKNETELMEILLPLLSALQTVHEVGLLHQDIQPSNIYLRNKDQSPVLLDFGAARYTLNSTVRNINKVIAPGYAAFEQYQTDKDNQGPWTDIYALGAVLYYAISGKPPIEATERENLINLHNKPDPLVPATQIGSQKYSKHLLQGIDAALNVYEKDRPKNVEQWIEILLNRRYRNRNLFKSSNYYTAVKLKFYHWIVIGIIAAVSLNIAYVLYSKNFLQKMWYEFIPKFQNIQQKTANEAAHLAQIQKNRKIEAECLRQLQDQTVHKIKYLKFLEQHPQISNKIDKHSVKRFRDRLQTGNWGPEMVEIPAGRFKMGNTQGNKNQEELPVHIVSIKSFAIGSYEVTFKEYDQFVKATGRRKPKDYTWGRCNRPVIDVSWKDAKAYTKWLSEQTNRQYRLPSEAEWEYVAKAGTTTNYWWGNKIGKNLANCADCGSKWDDQKTAPVGYFLPNPFGVYDTVGNVWEWVADPWHSNYKGAPQNGRVWVKGGKGDYRITRGGSWYINSKDSRAASRSISQPESRNSLFGFRVAAEKN